MITDWSDPRKTKELNNGAVLSLVKHFLAVKEQDGVNESDRNGISWWYAKNKLFEKVNEKFLPIRDSYDSLSSNKDLINELLDEGSSKVRPMAKELLLEVRESIGISKIS